MVNTELRILRVFGPTAAEVSAVLRQARADGCPGLRLLERDGEFAVCVQVSAPNRAMAEQYCEKWVQRLRAKFGDDVFATGETSLAQATLDTLLEKRKLLVTADETTGRLVGALLQPLPHSEAVFDFGTESYADPEKQKQITVPPQLLKKFPGDVVQAAAGRALAAMQRRTTHNDGSDGIHLHIKASIGLGGIKTGRDNDSGQGSQESHHSKGTNPPGAGAHPTAPQRHWVATQRGNVVTPAHLIKERDGKEQHQ